MIQINLTISEEDLRRPGVAEGLSDFLQAFAGNGKKPSRAEKTNGVPESFDTFRADLTPQTQVFLNLLEYHRGSPVVKSVVEKELRIAGKALGGMYGALSRKAQSRGVVLPVQMGRLKGERTWTWRS
jgi:hypothetical protein